MACAIHQPLAVDHDGTPDPRDSELRGAQAMSLTQRAQETREAGP